MKSNPGGEVGGGVGSSNGEGEESAGRDPLDGLQVGFGKHHKSMYTGSLVGKGAEVFAVMGYVISNMQPRRIGGREDGAWQMVVEMNPKLLAFILGETEAEIVAAIELLCAEDPESRTKDAGGRRLLKIGQFDYVVVNGKKYRGGRDPELRREQNRQAQERFRKKRENGASGGGRRSSRVKPDATGLTAKTAAVREHERAFMAGEVDQFNQPIEDPDQKVLEEFRRQHPEHPLST